MPGRQESNGEGGTLIDFVGGSPNHVLIRPHDAAHLPPSISAVINQALLDWLKKNPGIRARAVLPFVQDGQTAALHLWFDPADVPG